MNERNRSLDILKCLLAVFIIITHSSFADTNRQLTIFPLIIDIAVPVFLIISGYVNSIRYDETNYWSQNSMRRKCERILVPFLWIAVLQVIYWIFVSRLSTRDLIIKIVFQRWGDGGYYPIIMLQFVLLLPLVVRMTSSIFGCISVITINIISEFLFTWGSTIQGTLGTICVYTHRILILRYLGFIMAGILVYRYREYITYKITILFAILGFVIVYLLNFSICSRNVFGLWRTTSLPVVIWASSWVMIAILASPQKSNFATRILEIIGKSSYCIFLTQMVWYFLIDERIIAEPVLVVSITVCIMVGVAFSLIDKKVQKVLGETKRFIK